MIGTDSYHIVIEIPETQSNCSLVDYRFSPVEVTAIDISNTDMAAGDIEPLKAKFLGNGNIHLYREFEDDSSSLSLQSLTRSASPEPSLSPNETEGDDTMVSIIAVPTYFTATDLLGFIGESYMKYITHLRILKSEKPNRFLVLIKFNDILKTAEFQMKYNGKPFNSMEPEACHVVFVKSVKFDFGSRIDDISSRRASESLIPFLLNDPFTSPPASYPNSPNVQLSSSFDKHRNVTLMELPTCPVCLERMDSTVTGLLTIPCQHTFHCQCLSKWKDDTCPVCRYSNNVSNQKIRRSVRRLLQFGTSRLPHTSAPLPGRSSSVGSSNDPQSIDSNSEHCFDCQVDTNLWICLICGNLGCDRYAPDQHSLKHFINTGHCFAMELNTSRVWDYAGDNYVHRLVANESDGKLVELPEKETPGSSGQFSGYGSNINFKSNSGNSNFDKVDEVGFEYSQLLISQLASQREYYESLLNDKGSRSHRGSVISDSNQNSTNDLEAKFEDLSKKVADLTTNVIPALKSKISLKDERINKLSRELINSTSLNDGLSSKIEYLTEENKQLTAQNQDLNEQIKDLMFYLESQEKFKNQPEDVRDGTVVIQQNLTRKPKSKNKSKK